MHTPPFPLTSFDVQRLSMMRLLGFHSIRLPAVDLRIGSRHTRTTYKYTRLRVLIVHTHAITTLFLPSVSPVRLARVIEINLKDRRDDFTSGDSRLECAPDLPSDVCPSFGSATAAHHTFA